MFESLRRVILGAGLLVPVVLASTRAAAVEEIKACLTDLSLWGQKEKDGSFTGANADLLKAFAEKSKLTLSYVFAPYPRLIKNLESGACDITITLPPTDAKDIDVGPKYWTIRMGILPRPAAGIAKMGDLVGKKIGTLVDANLGPDFDNNKTFQKISLPTYSQLVAMLTKDRIDAIAGDLDILETLAKGMNYNPGKPLTMVELDLHVMVSKKSPWAKKPEQIHQIFKDLVSSGEARKIIVKNLTGQH